MSQRRSEIERWMSRRELPRRLRRKIREYEGSRWQSEDINEQQLMDSFPEELQREISNFFLLC
ncbi:hypothetical protein vseg_000815 [Gypsophila vaccaria]